MMNIKYLLFSLLCMICSCVVFAKDEIVVKSMVPIYDENSGVIVYIEKGVHNVVFNDKEQKVKYDIILENNTDEDIDLESITLPVPPEDFLNYKLTGVDNDKVLEANSTGKVILSLETIETEGWGRNFTLDLTSNIEADIFNPNTASNELIVILIFVALCTIVLFVIIKNQKISRYVVMVVMFLSVITIVNAKFSIEFPIQLTISFESKNIMKPAYVIEDDEVVMVDYWDYGYEIQNIYVQNEFSEINEYYKKFDVSENQDGRVIAYLVVNKDNDRYLDLYLQADGIIYMNPDASHYFDSMLYLEKIDNMVGFGTDNVVNMSEMFAYTGYYSSGFSIDLSKFDTSNVTNMKYMFRNTGSEGESFKLDLSNFNTSKVTDMSYMFYYTGALNKNLEIDLSSFDTSNVTDMKNMFAYTGHKVEDLELDLSNFNTSKVLDMSYMFSNTGRKSDKLNIILSSFDTGSVTNMENMFYYTGYESDEFSLDLSSFDTSNVTDMSQMFYFTGASSSSFTLDVSKFNTSKVTDMDSMFSNTGGMSTRFTLDLKNFDTSNVRSMKNMFKNLGNYNNNFKLDLSSFDTSNVTDMRGMFYYTGVDSTNFTLDVSSFDTKNVTDMAYMFYMTGYSNPKFTLDVSGFDTSKVTDFSGMFVETGFSSEVLQLDVSNFNTRNAVYMSEMFLAAGYSNPDFVLDTSNFRTGKVIDMEAMFYETGFNSNKCNIVIAIMNPNTEVFEMFYNTGYDTTVTINYSSSSKSYVDSLFDDEWGEEPGRYIKGVQVS